MKNKILLVFLALVLVVSLAVFGACAPPEEFTLKITAIGEGTTSPVPGTSTITEGESVTVTAIPNTGYELGYWEGDVSGTDDSVTFKMTSDMSVVAVFVEEVIVKEWEWPESLNILSFGVASAPYICDVAYSVLLEEDTGMKVRVVGEDSHILRYNWMKQQQFFWVTAENAHMIDMLQGEGEYASRDGGPWQMRVAYSAAVPFYLGFAVRGDSGIETPHDVKPGMKIGYAAYAGPAGRQMLEGLLAWAEVDPDDVVWVPASTPTMCTVILMDGRADVSFGCPTSAHWYEAEAGPHGLAWIDLNAEEDPEGYARLVKIMPWSMPALNDAGVPSSIGVYMLGDVSVKLTHADVDPDLVYHIVKWCDENFDRFKDAHHYLMGMNLDWLMDILARTYLPAHEGTIRYLTELGLWTDAHEARNQTNIELMTRWCEAYETAIDMADEQEIHVRSDNEEWLELWENYKTALGLPVFSMFVGLD